MTKLPELFASHVSSAEILKTLKRPPFRNALITRWFPPVFKQFSSLSHIVHQHKPTHALGSHNGFHLVELKYF